MIAIAEHLGVQGVDRREVLDDGIAYHCDLGLKAISTEPGDQRRPSGDGPALHLAGKRGAEQGPSRARVFPEQREINLLKEYAFAAKRDGVADPERTALQVLSAMEGPAALAQRIA